MSRQGGAAGVSHAYTIITLSWKCYPGRGFGWRPLYAGLIASDRKNSPRRRQRMQLTRFIPHLLAYASWLVIWSSRAVARSRRRNHT